MNSVFKDVYLLVRRQLSEVAKNCTDTEFRLLALRRSEVAKNCTDTEFRLLALRREEGKLLVMDREMAKYACRACGGEGSVRTVYAQDDIKFEPCEICRGTGLPYDPR